MVEIHIPSTYPSNSSIGIWESNDISNIGKHNELYLGKLNGQTIMKFHVDEVVFRLRCKGLLPLERVGSGIFQIMSPLEDKIVTDGHGPGLVIIDGKLQWTYDLVSFEVII